MSIWGRNLPLPDIFSNKKEEEEKEKSASCRHLIRLGVFSCKRIDVLQVLSRKRLSVFKLYFIILNFILEYLILLQLRSNAHWNLRALKCLSWLCFYYRIDAQKLEEWARSQNASTLIDFSSRQGEVEDILKDISERAGGKGNFSYSRFIAIGLFRLLELANATEPTVLEKVDSLISFYRRVYICRN